MNRKRTYRTITSLIAVFAFTLIFTGIENAAADEITYLTHGVRDTMSQTETVRLVMEEDRSVTRWEAENIVARMDAVQESETYGVRGNYRANLDTGEQLILVMEENRELTANNIPFIITNSIKTPDSFHPAGLGYHAPYVYGEVRANLSDKEKEALDLEERYK